MKIFDIIKTIKELGTLRKEVEMLAKENYRLRKRSDELEKNVDYLITENTTLKQVNRKKYLKYENKMKFLQDREIKLQNIEQMVKNGVDYRKVKNFIKGE